MLCAALVYSYGAVAQSSTAGVSRQVQALKTAMESFRTNINGRVTAMETQFKDCPDGEKYGTVEYNDCPNPGEIGFILRQCINGSWSREVNSCIVPYRQYVVNHLDGRITHRPDDIVFADAIDLKGSDCVNADGPTMDRFCKDQGYKGYQSSTNFSFSSCGDNSLLKYYDGDYSRTNACAAGGVCALAITCTNMDANVVVVGSPEAPAPWPPVSTTPER